MIVPAWVFTVFLHAIATSPIKYATGSKQRLTYPLDSAFVRIKVTLEKNK